MDLNNELKEQIESFLIVNGSCTQYPYPSASIYSYKFSNYELNYIKSMSMANEILVIYKAGHIIFVKGQITESLSSVINDKSLNFKVPTSKKYVFGLPIEIVTKLKTIIDLSEKDISLISNTLNLN